MKLKRTLLILTVVIAAAISVCASASAAHASDLLYTGIGAYINHYPITSFACDGKTVVAAEDLKNFGFTVNWNESTKTLDIQTDPYCGSIKGMSGVKKHTALSGERYASAQNNAVTAYVNGVWLNSYTYNGYTYVALEDLAAVGEFTWDEYTMSSRLWLDWMPITQYQPIPEDPNDQYLAQPESVQEQHDSRYDTTWVYGSGMNLLVPAGASVETNGEYTVIGGDITIWRMPPGYVGEMQDAQTAADILNYFKKRDFYLVREDGGWVNVLSENNTYFAGVPARQMTYVIGFPNYSDKIWRTYGFVYKGYRYVVNVVESGDSWSNFMWWKMELVRTGSKMAF